MGDQPFGSTILLGGDLRSKYNLTMPKLICYAMVTSCSKGEIL